MNSMNYLFYWFIHRFRLFSIIFRLKLVSEELKLVSERLKLVSERLKLVSEGLKLVSGVLKSTTYWLFYLVLLFETFWESTSTVSIVKSLETQPFSIVYFSSISIEPRMSILFFLRKRFGSFSKMNSKTESLFVRG